MELEATAPIDLDSAPLDELMARLESAGDLIARGLGWRSSMSKLGLSRVDADVLLALCQRREPFRSWLVALHARLADSRLERLRHMTGNARIHQLGQPLALEREIDSIVGRVAMFEKAERAAEELWTRRWDRVSTPVLPRQWVAPSESRDAPRPVELPRRAASVDA
jgi:hypothetical protein